MYYGLFSLCVIHKKGLCSSSGDISRLMMMMTVYTPFYKKIVTYLNI
jgi:hypothetical protein